MRTLERDSPLPALVRPPFNPAVRNRKTIGHYLKEKRKELGLTQQQLLDALGSDAWWTAWSAVERGERSLPPYMWEAVANLLGIPNEEFADTMLRHTNPWAHGMLFGFTPELRAELAEIPERYGD